MMTSRTGLLVAWLVVAAVTAALADDDDRPHDGSLAVRDEIMDGKNGRLDEASGVVVALEGCVRSAGEENPNAEPFCRCFVEYMRTSRPSEFKKVMAAGKTGDASEVTKLPGIVVCQKWVTNGARGKTPHLRKGMRPSTEVIATFMRCRKNMTKGKPTPSGIIFCNKLTATVK